ncbi:hypothetical protein QMM92_20535, partial [Leptospira santarosai]|nr:hypothetical protein [Leptospira santarosai]
PTESLELDEIQKIRNTKTELSDDPEQSYFQETDGSLIEGIQVEKEILNLNPNLERKVQPSRLRNDKLQNETIGSLQNAFEIHDAPSDPILIRGSVVDLKTLDLTSLYSVPWEWETDT